MSMTRHQENGMVKMAFGFWRLAFGQRLFERPKANRQSPKAIFPVRLCYTGPRRGYITLVSVLVVGAVGAAICVSILLLGLAASRNGFVSEQSKQARVLADACGEEALQQLRDSTAFAGSGSLSFGQGSCRYAVTNLGGENRLVMASSTVGVVVRKERAMINKINPLIQVVSWQDIAD